ncbi:hypothetical protein FA95DRAFT_255419 [Auriscalpium vulgare]|uniref:Uncharacterized protein n=1 Tax=Auriscalpium vulgare TaxID=40419 RepID=A0ACB8RK04_9AGAM|nr:hypothetical protein FA95DRAFT_255419 [Auriscalpium vulgare]
MLECAQNIGPAGLIGLGEYMLATRAHCNFIRYRYLSENCGTYYTVDCALLGLRRLRRAVAIQLPLASMARLVRARETSAAAAVGLLLVLGRAGDGYRDGAAPARWTLVS